MGKPLHARMPFNKKLLAAFGLIAWMLSACAAATPTPGIFSITIEADRQTFVQQVPPGSTVQLVLDKAGITLGNLDRVDPPAYTLLTNPTSIKVTRVREVFEVEESVIPFTRQVVKNESMPTNQKIIVQAGAPGLLQVTYRQLFENDVEVSRAQIKAQTVTEPQPEIEMVGVQSPFMAMPIPGKIAYLSMGNAWLMERSTAQRRPLVTSGDLDGRIFSLSPDRKWLLYSRKSALPPDEEINTLWVISTIDENARPLDLKTSNVVHFADWAPGKTNTIYYSSVEPRASAPGWQANNDLVSLIFVPNSTYLKREEVLAANSGGVYGWWGTSFTWSPDGSRLAYARSDNIGLVDLKEKSWQPLMDLLPYQTRSEWAWVPGVTWSPDNRMLYTINHLSPTGGASTENSQFFDVVAFNPEVQQIFPLVAQAGMFSYPSASPAISGKRTWIAFLKPFYPEQSETSRYRLAVMDRDGSNLHMIFPDEGTIGLDPQPIVWSPATESSPAAWIAILYRGNIYFIDPSTGQGTQITGDGLMKRVEWK